MEKELVKFIDLFKQLFEDTEIDVFTPECKFKELDEWSSLIALSIVGMVDEEYDVSLKGEDIKSSETIIDLYKLVISKTNE